MAVIRPRKRSDAFAQISNVLLQDAALSSKARGIACMLLSFPPGWTTTINRLADNLERDGYTAVRTAFIELEQRGYMIREQPRDDQGRLMEQNQVIFDDPSEAAEYLAENGDEDSASAVPSPMPITKSKKRRTQPDADSASAGVADSDPSVLFGVDAVTPDNARAKLAEIRACSLCDDSGHVHGTVADCDHVQPKQHTRAKAVRDDAATNAAKLSALHATRHEDAVHDTLAYLADTVERNGSRRPAFDAVDYERMAELIKHERSRPEGAAGAEVRIRQVIDWTQTDGHWQPIILTAEKLHEHYDAVRLRTVNAYKTKQNSGSSGGRPNGPGAPRTTRNSRVAQGMDLARQYAILEGKIPADSDTNPLQITEGPQFS